MLAVMMLAMTSLQAALHTSCQTQAKLESELQQLRTTASSNSAAATKSAAASQAELEKLQQQLRDSQQQADALKSREEEARMQAKQLATALTAAQVDHQVKQQCVACDTHMPVFAQLSFLWLDATAWLPESVYSLSTHRCPLYSRFTHCSKSLRAHCPPTAIAACSMNVSPVVSVAFQHICSLAFT